MRLDHVGVNVADLAKAEAWYCAALGLEREIALRIDAVDLDIVMLRHARARAPGRTAAPGGRPSRAACRQPGRGRADRGLRAHRVRRAGPGRHARPAARPRRPRGNAAAARPGTGGPDVVPGRPRGQPDRTGPARVERRVSREPGGPADVVIAGYGPAGAAAAIAAHDAGASVLVVESTAEGGGNARYSGGFLFDIPGPAAADAPGRALLRPDAPPGAGRLRCRAARPGRLAARTGRRDRAVRPAAGPAARPVPVLAVPARRARHRLPGGGGRHRPPRPGTVGCAGRRGARAWHRGALPDRGRAAGPRPGRDGDRPDRPARWRRAWHRSWNRSSSPRRGWCWPAAGSRPTRRWPPPTCRWARPGRSATPATTAPGCGWLSRPARRCGICMAASAGSRSARRSSRPRSRWTSSPPAICSWTPTAGGSATKPATRCMTGCARCSATCRATRTGRACPAGPSSTRRPGWPAR